MLGSVVTVVYSWLTRDAANRIRRGYNGTSLFDPPYRPCLRVWVDAVLDALLEREASPACGVRSRSLFAWPTAHLVERTAPAEAQLVQLAVKPECTWAADVTAIDPLFSPEGPEVLRGRLNDRGWADDRLTEELPFLVKPTFPMATVVSGRVLRSLESALRRDLLDAMSPELVTYAASLVPLADRDSTSTVHEILVPAEGLVTALAT